MKFKKKIAGVLMAALCITTLSFTGAKTVRADGNAGTGSSATSEVSTGEQGVSTGVQNGASGDWNSSIQTGDEPVTAAQSPGIVSPKKVIVESFDPDDEETTVKLTLTLKEAVPDLVLTKDNLEFIQNDVISSDKNDIDVKATEPNRVYEITVKALKAGDITLKKEIKYNNKDYILGIEDDDEEENVNNLLTVDILKKADPQGNAVNVTEFTAKPGIPTTELTVTFDKEVPGLKKTSFTFVPASTVAEILEVTPSENNKIYTIKIKAKKRGILKLSGVKEDGYNFTIAEGTKEANIKVYDPSEEEEEALLLEKKAEEKKAEEKKAEEKKAEEKKVEEKKTEEKKAEEKKIEEKTADVVVTTKKSKALNVTVKEDTIKAALEKDTDLVIKNKKQKVEIAPELLKMVHDKFGVFKMTLKPVKEKALFVTGAKHTRAYDFKINNKTMKTAEPVKVTLNYKGAKLPKVYVVGKNGKLTEVKGVKLDKATKTVSFNTKHIKKFVLAY